MTAHFTPELRQDLAALAAKIATKVGHKIHSMRSSGVQVAETKSSLTDVVTEADQLAETMVVEMLKRTRPEDAILGEEGTSHSGTTGITWIIDPIDGTVNYLYDLPAYCVSIAACVADSTAFADGQRAIAAAVYNPQTDELFVSAQGQGATRNGTQIHVNSAVSLDTSLVATGFGYTAERRSEQAAILTRVLPKIRDIRRIGTAAYDLCLLASGRVDAYYERGIQPWDYAAGALIATEAGATVLGRNEGAPAGEPLFVAAHAEIVRQLRDLIVHA